MYTKLFVTVLLVQSFASVAFGAVAIALNTENKGKQLIEIMRAVNVISVIS